MKHANMLLSIVLRNLSNLYHDVKRMGRTHQYNVSLIVAVGVVILPALLLIIPQCVLLASPSVVNLTRRTVDVRRLAMRVAIRKSLAVKTIEPLLIQISLGYSIVNICEWVLL